MSLGYKFKRKTAEIAINRTLKYIEKNPEENFQRLAGKAEKLFGGMFPSDNFKKIKAGAADPANTYTRLAKSILSDIDKNIIRTMLLALGFDAAYYGTKKARANREKLKCNIPWVILMDPTSACNLKCKGCWAAEYDRQQSLTNDELQSVITQGKELGVNFYMYTGGEPLIRKKDIIKICEANPDCGFLIYTNATLIDRDFCREMKRVGNVGLAISIEGTVESNDYRRGDGSHEKVIKAMELLKEEKCLFGISVCYTRKNLDAVTSDEFMDKMVSLGSKYAWYFNYMPVGQGADPELIPTPEQRKFMYSWVRRMRNSKTGKPMFVIDFQDDGEFVGGCIAGGRNYFHVNSAGDIEPCVFIHFSDSNIRTHTLLEALQNPLFQAYRHNQPFNDNHLRPCPMLENPEYLRQMIKQTGAKSTNLLAPEDVETLCSRCDKFAAEWAPEADKLWNSTPHRKTHTQYYRDTPEGKAELENKNK